MQIHRVLLCILATIPFAASAANDTPPGKSRAEVKAETLRALAAGEITFGDVGYPKSATVPTSKARVHAKSVASPASTTSSGPAS